MISIRHLKKQFGDLTPIADLSAEIKKGDAVAVIGPSGTGKSTLLRCIAFLEKPDGGEILLDGVNPAETPSALRKIGMVFQYFNLFPHMRVWENVAFAPIKSKKWQRSEARERALQYLREVSMASFADAFPESLSGGQKQRVAIARTLATEPEILLLDEPTSALDPSSVFEVENVLSSLKERKLTIVVVSHDMRLCESLSDRVFYLDEGGLYEEGTPEEIFHTPKREKTRQFILASRSCEVSFSSSDFDLFGYLSRLEDFAREHSFSRRRSDAVRHLAEEVCTGILFPVLSGPTEVRLSLHYEEQGDKITLEASYPGEDLSPFHNADPISLAMIRHYTASISEKCDRSTVTLTFVPAD